MGMSAKMYVDDKVYNIYRLQYGFHQEINTNGTAATHPLGGLFDIELDSPKNTHLYAWGASNYQMKHVKLVFSQTTEATRSRTIELYDTLCIGHHDYFSNGSKDPMRSVLKLSPAIIMQDGKIMFEKNWKVTDLSRQNVELTAVLMSSVSEEEQEEENVKLLVEKLEGPFTEEGRIVQEMLENNTYIFKVTQYNDAKGDKLANTKWNIEIDLGGKLEELPKNKAYKENENICYKYRAKKGTKLRIYAFCDSATKNVSIEIPIVTLPLYIDRYKKVGLNIEGTAIADDLCYGDGINLATGHSKYSIKEIEELSLLFKIQLAASDENLWNDFEIMVTSIFSVGELENVAKRMINHFKQNTGSEFTDLTLTKFIIEHPSTQRFCHSMENLIAYRLREKDLNLRFISYNNYNNGSDIPRINDEKWGHPHYNTLSDTFSGGLTICMNDVWAYEVMVTKVLLGVGKYQITYKVILYDHFGLDKPDMEKIYRFGAGFRSWFILQHQRNFKPFVSKVEFYKTFEFTL